MEVKNESISMDLLKKERKDNLMAVYLPTCSIKFPFINAMI